MDPETFYLLNDLGATEEQMRWVLNGAMPAETLIAHLSPQPEQLAPPPPPAAEPIPVAPPPPAPVAIEPLPAPIPQQLPVVQEVALPQIAADPMLPELPPAPVYDPPMGSWLIEPEEDPEPEPEEYSEPEEQAMNGYQYPQFAGSEVLVPMVTQAVVSTATEKLFDKGGNGGVSKLASTSGRSYRPRRRRRRRLLTCSDKADIAYLVGQLGQGQLGKAAISALLSRRCG